MNSGKAKRDESSKRKSILFAAILLISGLLIVAASFVLFRPVQNTAFVTQAWDDPHWICATAFSYEYLPLDAETFQHFEATVERLDLTIQLEEIVRLQSDNRCMQGGELKLSFIVSSELLNDEEALGQFIRALISLPETDSEIVFPTVVHLSFHDAERQAWKSWVFPIRQAQQAIEAGVSGAELFRIGREN